MNVIYTATVAMTRRVPFMGGKLMHALVSGEKTCNFTNVEEADRFATLMQNKGYEVEIGIVRATAEEWAKQVEEYHTRLGNSFAAPKAVENI